MGNRHSQAGFEHYDEPGVSASLADCTFCQIVLKHEGRALSRDAKLEEDRVIYSDELVVIFRDIKDRAKAHYQCVPRRHIKNFTFLDLRESTGSENEEESADLVLLKHMQSQGLRFLSEEHPGTPARDFRMGFHSPGHNSQHHLHLHLIVLPFKGGKLSARVWDRLVYGSYLVSVPQVLERQLSRREDLSKL